MSPARISSTGIYCSEPPRSTQTVLGARFISDFSALVVFPFEYASSIFPNVIKVGIIAALSKYRKYFTSPAVPFFSERYICTSAKMLHKNETPEPSATSVSIFAPP